MSCSFLILPLISESCLEPAEPLLLHCHKRLGTAASTALLVRPMPQSNNCSHWFPSKRWVKIIKEGIWTWHNKIHNVTPNAYITQAFASVSNENLGLGLVSPGRRGHQLSPVPHLASRKQTSMWQRATIHNNPMASKERPEIINHSVLSVCYLKTNIN